MLKAVEIERERIRLLVSERVDALTPLIAAQKTFVETLEAESKGRNIGAALDTQRAKLDELTNELARVLATQVATTEASAGLAKRLKDIERTAANTAGSDGGGRGIRKLRQEMQGLEGDMAALNRAVHDTSAFNKPLDDHNKAIKAREEFFKTRKSGVEEELRLGKLTEEQREIEIRLAQFLSEAKSNDIELTAQQIAQQRELIEKTVVGLKEIERSKAKAKEAAREWQRIWDQAASKIEDGLRDTFRDALDGNLSSTRDFAQAFKSLMFDAIADVAAAMVFKPLVQSVIGPVANAASNALGLPSPGGAFGGGVPGVNPMSSITNALGLTSPFASSFAGGTAALSAGAAGFAPSAAALSGGFITSTAGSGGAAAALAGGGSVALGGEVLGAGAAAGTFAAAAPFLAAALPIAAIAAPFILSAVLGGKQQRSNANATLKIVNGQAVLGPVGSDNLDPAGAVAGANQVIQQLNQLAQQSGLKLQAPTGPGDLRRLLQTGVVQSETGDFARSADQLFAELARAGILGDPNSAAVKFALAGRSLKGEKTAFNTGVSDALLGFNDPQKLVRLQLQRQQDAMAEQAKEFGVNLGSLNKLFKKQNSELADRFAEENRARLGAVQQRARQFISTTLTPLQRFRSELDFGAASGLTPGDQVSAARADFSALIPRLQAGQLSAFQALPGVGDRLRQLSFDTFAGGPQFAADLDLVRKTTDQFTGVLENQQDNFASLGIVFEDTIAGQTKTLEKELRDIKRLLESRA